MITDRLKEMELRKKDFAVYLRISRPTLDKFIEAYESGKSEIVNPRIRKVFDFIEENPLAGKNSVQKFIISISEGENEPAQPSPESEESEQVASVRKFIKENPDSPKAHFFDLATKTTDFDDVIRYSLKIKPLLRERRLTEEQIALLKPYDDIRAIMENNTTEE